MAEGKRDWTPEQLTAIHMVDRPLLVSAAAGSGKTSVLAQRCAHLICDAEPPQRCDVNELLVVTFTRAAAAEMRQRIEANLRGRDGGNDRRLQRQIQLLDSADISTLHSFCTRVLRRHFSLIGLDPSFTTLDEADAMLLRSDVCRELIRNTYDTERGDALSSFVDRYCSNSDESLRRHILRLHDLRSSTVDPGAWSHHAIQRMSDAASQPLHETEVGRQLVELMRFEVDALLRRGRSIARTADRQAPKYAAHVAELLTEFESWQAMLTQNRLSDFRRVSSQWFTEVPRSPVDRAAPDHVRTSLKQFKDSIKKSNLKAIIRFSNEELAATAQAVLAPLQLLLQLVDEFGKRYAAAKQAIRAVDFSDLERLTFHVLTDPADRTKPSPAALAYRGQFKHVLVDEYQDINGLQDRILQLVSRNPTDTSPGNLFCVGDVKQSIYRFRLADPSQFLRRAAAYRGQPVLGTLVPLSKNFRSDQGIVSAVNAVFERLMSEPAAEIDYDASHALHFGKSPDRSRALPAPVELHLLPDADAPDSAGAGDEGSSESGSNQPSDDPSQPTDEDDDDDRTEREAELCARLISQLTAADAAERFEFRDIAILLRSKKVRAEKFANRLRLRGIPVLADSTTGFFDAVEIRDMLSLLQCLDNTRQDIPLAALLRSPLARLDNPADVLAQIRIGQPKLPFHEAVFAFAQTNTPPAAAVRGFLDQLQRWRATANLKPLAGVLWEILQETGYLAYCSLLPDGRQRVANLLSLHDRARAFGQFSRQGLRRFLQFLEALKEEQDLGLPPAGDEPGNVVRVMSIHASKGLQFPVVIVPELAKAFNLGDLHGSMLVDRDEYVALDVVDADKRARWPSVATLVAKPRLRRRLLAEELRILYVAMTRAENKLILTGSLKKLDATVAGWRTEWAAHRGPLPADVILSARTMLDWIGPAAVGIENIPGGITIHQHTLDVLQTEGQMNRRKRGPDDVPPEIRQFKPLRFAVEPSPRADEVLAALSWQLPTLALSQIPAARAVTQLTKSGREAPAGESPSIRPIVRFTPPLPLPRFATPGRRATPTEIGNATHHVLQAIDLSCPPTQQAVQAAIARLVERRTVRPDEAAAVDLDAICWFLSTPLCHKLASADVELFRELPIFAPADAALGDAPSGEPTPATPLDRVMLRGQIDVLARAKGGLILADYKTDRVTDQTLAARVDFYRPQVQTYRRMLESIAGQPVVETALVFLVPRQIISV